MIFFTIIHLHFKGNALTFILEVINRGKVLWSIINHGKIVPVDSILL